MLEMSIPDLLREAAMKGSSDMHITVGVPPMVRINGSVVALGDYPVVTQEISKKLVY